jgi:MFS transporter, PPP family, 3-phenylpropionic acid transporter
VSIPSRARAALAYVGLFAAVGSGLNYLPLYYASLGLAIGEIGGVLALGAFVGLAASPAWGALSDRSRGSPLVFLAAVATALGGAALLALSQERIPLMLGAGVFGAGMAGVSPILDARALETAGANRSGYGPLRAWGSVSYIVSALVTGAAIEASGIRALFLVLVPSLIATGLFGLALRPPTIRLETVVAPLRNAGRLFGRRGLGAVMLGTFLSWLGMSAVLSFTPLRFAELGAGATIIGLGGAIAAAIEVPLMLRFPALAARFGPERLFVAGAFFIAVRSIVAAVAQDPPTLLFAAVFGGLGFALFFVGGVTYVSTRVPPELAATAQGIFQGIGSSLSQVTAALLGGAIATALGIQGLFGVAIAVGLAGAAIVAVAIRSGRGAAVPVPAESW